MSQDNRHPRPSMSPDALGSQEPASAPGPWRGQETLSGLDPSSVIAAIQHQLWRNHEVSTTCDGCRGAVDILNALTNSRGRW